MKLQKLSAILMAAVIASSLGTLFGCSGTGSGSQSTPKEPVVPTVNAPADMTGGTVTPEVDTPANMQGGTAITPEVNTPTTGGEGGSWVPGIFDDTLGSGTIEDIDDSQKYVYDSSTVSFATVAGSLSFSQGQGEFTDFVTQGGNSMAVCDNENAPFPYGTITCNVKTKTNTDSGIVFGLSSNGIPTYWEGYGISYYFFFLGQDGTAYLGKTDNGGWTVCAIVDYTFNDTDTYELKVVYKGSKICGYVNGELMVSYRDGDPLTGTGFGVRSGGAGVSFSDLAVTNEYLY